MTKKHLLPLVILLFASPLQATTVTLDLIFLMDGSGSIGSSGWDNEEEFVTSMLETGVSESTRAGILQFTASINTVHALSDDQSRPPMVAAVEALSFPGGPGYMDDAFQSAIDMFDAQSSPTIPKAIILITDATYSSGHNPIVLRPELDSRNIPVFVVGVGVSWDPSLIEGMVDDPETQIVEAFNVDQTFIEAIGALALPEPSSALMFLGASLALLLRRERPF